MFLGEYTHALDARGRIIVPARFRSELETGLVVTRGYDPCLVIYPLDGWTALASRVAQTSAASRNARSYGRLVFGGAYEATLDSMGRVLIPAFLREYAGIEEEAVVVGVNTYLEIWHPEKWRDALERDAQNLDAILADMTNMGV